MVNLKKCRSAGVRFIFLQALPPWVGPREAASTDEWQQDDEDRKGRPTEPKAAGSEEREEGRVQRESVEREACTTATGS